MAFNQFTQPLQQQDIYKPIDDSLLLLGAQTRYKRAEDTAKTIGSQYNSLFNISTYGKDAEVLNQLNTSFKEQVSELAKSGLDNPETQAKINNLINQYSSNPDVLAIHQRKSLYDIESKKQADAMEKGKTYISPALEGLGEYYSGSNYYRNANISMNTGFLAPEISKLQKAALEITPEQKKWITLPSGERMQVSTKDPNDLRRNLNAVLSEDPNAQKWLQYSFNKNYGNLDWENEGRNKIVSDLENLDAQINEITSNGGDASAHLAQYEKLTKLLQSGLVGEPLKQQTFNNWYQQNINDMADAMDYVQQGNIEMGELTKMALAHQYSKKLKLFEAQIEAGQIEGIPAKASDLDKEIYKATIASGRPIYDNNGKIIPASQLASQQGLAYNAAESRDAITSIGGKQVQVPTKIKNLISTLETGTSLNSQEDEDLRNLVLNNKEVLGIPDYEIPNIKVVGDNIEVEVDDWGFNSTVKIPKSEFLEKVISPITNKNTTSSQPNTVSTTSQNTTNPTDTVKGTVR